MNPRIEKIAAEIEKLRGKVTYYQNRLRDLERQKTELENADIIALVRGVDIPHDELAAFVRMFQQQHNLAVAGQVPQADLPNNLPNNLIEETQTKNDKEDELLED